MSNSEKSPTPLERLKQSAEYCEAQAVSCEKEAKECKKYAADLAAMAEDYRKQVPEIRAAIKTLEDAAWRATFDYAKPGRAPRSAFKYDFKSGDRVEYRSSFRAPGVVKTGYIGDNGSSDVVVDWDGCGVITYCVCDIAHAPAKPEYNFKVGDRVKHKNDPYGCGTVSEAHTGTAAYSVVKVRPDYDPNVVHGWSAYNLTKIT